MWFAARNICDGEVIANFANKLFQQEQKINFLLEPFDVFLHGAVLVSNALLRNH
jgi:hypothetical protein